MGVGWRGRQAVGVGLMGVAWPGPVVVLVGCPDRLVVEWGCFGDGDPAWAGGGSEGWVCPSTGHARLLQASVAKSGTAGALAQGSRCGREEEGRARAWTRTLGRRNRRRACGSWWEPGVPGPASQGGTRPGVRAAACVRLRCKPPGR